MIFSCIYFAPFWTYATLKCGILCQSWHFLFFHLFWCTFFVSLFCNYYMSRFLTKTFLKNSFLEKVLFKQAGASYSLKLSNVRYNSRPIWNCNSWSWTWLVWRCNQLHCYPFAVPKTSPLVCNRLFDTWINKFGEWVTDCFFCCLPNNKYNFFWTYKLANIYIFQYYLCQTYEMN